jgi:hypothetical protein
MSYGQNGVHVLFDNWVADKDKANSACLIDDSLINVDVGDTGEDDYDDNDDSQ